MWDHLLAFLKAAVPAAEEHQIRLAAHPNDPPVPEYRGVAQPLADLAGWQRLIDIVDSPSNCLFFDTGVTTELGEDAVRAIHTFGHRQRIGTVHYRNVRVIEPRKRYIETFIDAGDADMLGCMRAFFAVGFEGALDPDHTPGLVGDREEEDTHTGWAYAVGHMRALRLAAMAPPA